MADTTHAFAVLALKPAAGATGGWIVVPNRLIEAGRMPIVNPNDRGLPTVTDPTNPLAPLAFADHTLAVARVFSQDRGSRCRG